MLVLFTSRKHSSEEILRAVVDKAQLRCLYRAHEELEKCNRRHRMGVLRLIKWRPRGDSNEEMFPKKELRTFNFENFEVRCL